MLGFCPVSPLLRLRSTWVLFPNTLMSMSVPLPLRCSSLPLPSYKCFWSVLPAYRFHPCPFPPHCVQNYLSKMCIREIPSLNLGLGDLEAVGDLGLSPTLLVLLGSVQPLRVTGPSAWPSQTPVHLLRLLCETFAVWASAPSLAPVFLPVPGALRASAVAVWGGMTDGAPMAFPEMGILTLWLSPRGPSKTGCLVGRWV